ncbi:MAG TPA: NlpC/P60 family protein [Campylobacterales bacterium]|nr:NlpC/P60 family protein [Campylobacterales bacterium]
MKRFISILIFLSLLTGCMERQRSLDNNIISSQNIIVKTAKKYLGKPYRYGAIGPNSFDCSGFVYAVFKEVGIPIPRTSLAQSKIRGKKLSKKELKAGDLLSFDTSLKGHINHSGIYIGNHKFIHASSGKAHSVTISSLDGWYKDKFRWGKRVNYP